jgi:two-component system sensor histidine kinase KdpD
VSHDLRTPLSTIRAVVSDLREGGGGYDEATRDELLDLVVDEAERLDRFVANLLSLSRVEAGALTADRQALALEELLEQCVRRHARLVRDRKVSIDVPLTLPLVDADWTLVEQAVTNLVANAVRHAPEGSRIWVAAREEAPGWVTVRVRDQGPGIPASLRDAVLEPFRRGPGSTSSGVGLATVRAVVDAHGGELAIDDADGGGAEVRFTLPVHGGGARGR